MNETNLTQQRESDISSCSDDESNGENYENYRTKSLPEGYTAYRKAGQADENVYDRYGSDYESASTPDQERDLGPCESKKSCCKIGWLFKHRSKIQSVPNLKIQLTSEFISRLKIA